jgi:hypothetical protein
MDASTRSRCSACQDVLTDAVTCAACDAPHHADCWSAKGHCATCLSGKPPVAARGARSGITVPRVGAAIAACWLAVCLIPNSPAPPPGPPLTKLLLPAPPQEPDRDAWLPMTWNTVPGMSDSAKGQILGAGVHRAAFKLPGRNARFVIVWARVADLPGRRHVPEARLTIAVADSTVAATPDLPPSRLAWVPLQDVPVLDRATRPIKVALKGSADRLAFSVRDGESVSIERIVLLESNSFKPNSWEPRAGLMVRALHKDRADLLHPSWANAHVPARLIRRTGPAPAPALLTNNGIMVRLGPSERGLELFATTEGGMPPERAAYERLLLEQLDPARAVLSHHIFNLDLDFTLLSDGTAEVVSGKRAPFVWPMSDPEEIASVIDTIKRGQLGAAPPSDHAVSGTLAVELARRVWPGPGGREEILAKLKVFERLWRERRVMPAPLAVGDRVALVAASGAELFAEKSVNGELRLVERQPPPGVEPWSGWVPQRFFDAPPAALVGHTLRFVRTGHPALRD